MLCGVFPYMQHRDKVAVLSDNPCKPRADIEVCIYSREDVCWQ